MKTSNFVKSVALIAILSAGTAHGADLIQNGSFENGGTFVNRDFNSMELNTNATTISNWTVTGPQIAWIQNGNNYGLNASLGTHFLDLTGWNTNGLGGVSQTINTDIGTKYTLGFDLGNDSRYNGVGGATLTASAGITSSPFTNNVALNDKWAHYTMNFVATNATTTIALTGFNSEQYIGLDNVSVTAVPEPETYAMLLAGLGLMGFMSRRKSVKKAA